MIPEIKRFTAQVKQLGQSYHIQVADSSIYFYPKAKFVTTTSKEMAIPITIHSSVRQALTTSFLDPVTFYYILSNDGYHIVGATGLGVEPLGLSHESSITEKQSLLRKQRGYRVGCYILTILSLLLVLNPYGLVIFPIALVMFVYQFRFFKKAGKNITDMLLRLPAFDVLQHIRNTERRHHDHIDDK
jgi:hypothetical protein